jgi:imidazolonepropionase-like amidohydrolase
MKLKLCAFSIIFLFFSCKLYSQRVTFPTNDVADERQNIYAFTNATVFIDHSLKIENGTLLIQGAKILASGQNINIPQNAIIVDCKGKFIYPSFIDTDSDYGMPEVKRGGGSFFNFEMESKKRGSFGWNQAIQPETDAANLFTINQKQADELRKIGFGAVITHNHDGIARGSSALVALVDDSDQNALLKTKVSAHYSFTKGSSMQSYPNSMMGSVALLRQTYLDADWYKNQKNSTEKNLSLEAFNQSQNQVQVFEALDRNGILRADKIGDEFKKQYVLVGGGDEYQRISEIKATGASLIVPLNYPAPYDVEDPLDAKEVSLAELKHWEMAPLNAGLLAKEGLEFSLTTANIKIKKDFFANLLKAVENGLLPQDALKALTTLPAKQFNISELVGSLKPGLLANFVISEGDIFRKENTIYENWVKGKRNILAEMNLIDIRGKYKATLGAEKYNLNISGKIDAPEYEIQINDSLKITPKVNRSENFLTIRYSQKNTKNKETRISGYLEGQNIKGTAEKPDGSMESFSAIYDAPFVPSVAKKDSTAKQNPVISKITYPFGAYGNLKAPKTEAIIIKNATVWTNEKEGIMQNTDVQIENGKIKRLGKNLQENNINAIDGTGLHLTNGIIDEHSHIALFTINEGGESVTAEVRTGDVIDPDDIDIYRELAGGTTSAQLLHGSANSIGGQSSLIKLKWGETAEGLKIKDAPAFIKFALGENVTRKGAQGGGGNAAPRYPQSRMGVEQVMMDAFNKAKAYDEAWKKYNATTTKDVSLMPRKNLELEALAEIINKKRFITCHSYVQSEINMMMKVAESFNFRVNTFTHILEGYKVASLMAKHGVGGSTFSDWWAYKMEVRDAIPYNAALMHRAGVTVAINSDDAEMARRLNQEAAKTVLYGGLTEEEAWKTVTLNPAKLLHLDNKMGSIKAGKDADLVLWNNNPLSIYARPQKTFIDGAVYFDRDTDEKMILELQKEKAILIQKMIDAKSSGAPTKKPSGAKANVHSCDDDRDGFSNN